MVWCTIKVSELERVAEILKVVTVMAANSRVCICSVLVCLLPLALATRGLRPTLFSVNWTLDWIVANYPDKTPLEVKLNDVLKFNCTNGTVANLYFLSEAEARDCRCDGDSSTCQSLGECRGTNQITTRIQTTSGMSASLVSYRPGTTYYFASFGNGSGTVFQSSGGECKLGFRLVLEVEDDSTPPPSDPMGSPPTRSEPTEPTEPTTPPSRRPMRPISEGLGSAVSSMNSDLLTLLSVVLCAMVATLLRH